MKKIYAAALAAIFGLGLTATPLYALADRDDHNSTSNHDRGNRTVQRDRDDRTARGYNTGNRNGNYNGGYNNGGYNNGGYNNGGNNNGGYNSGGYNNGGYNNGGYNNGNNNGNYNGGYNNGRNQANASVSGRIISVSGNRITILQNYTNAVTINDQLALDRQSTGRVYIGRSVTAYGYWQNGTFYATSLS